MFVCVSSLSAQQRYITKAGEILFEASVPSFEEVKATNNGVSAILNPETGEFAALALIKGFRFKVALMEEHFNENYIESSKYPKATFKGIIKGFKISEISAVKKEFRVKGTLNLHGVDKELELPLNVSQENGTMLLQLSFILKPEEFDIKIPKIVSSKIADEIEVTADFSLKK
jgi:hypothetical protein